MQTASFELAIDEVTGPLEVHSFAGAEELSRAWSFDVVVSGDVEHEMERVALGQRATITLHLSGRSRVLHGVVERVALEERLIVEGRASFSVRVVPRLAMLELTKRSRIFQEMSVPEIVASVLGDAGIAIRLALCRIHPKRAYCTQYEETDYDFIRRLVAEAFEIGVHNKKFPSNKARDAKRLKVLQDFVDALATQPEQSVGVVNIVTHANPGRIALSGKVDPDGTTWLDGWADEGIGASALADHPEDQVTQRSFVLQNSRGLELHAFWSGTLAEGWFNNPLQGKPVRDRIRTALAYGAEFHIYACHTGDDTNPDNAQMMQAMADTFGVYVWGFTVPISYIPLDPSNPSARTMERTMTGVGASEAEAKTNRAAGLLHNDKTRFVRVFCPAPPSDEM